MADPIVLKTTELVIMFDYFFNNININQLYHKDYDLIVKREPGDINITSGLEDPRWYVGASP